MPLVAITTDFGQQDPFVGIMKGVIASICPPASLVDCTHNIPPGDIQKAAVSLWMAKPYFPDGTVVLCVVDPGVGTDRKAVIARDDRYIFVGPDNGVFTFILGDEPEVYELSNPHLQLPDRSATFHGRDIFAPAAAHAANGVPLPEFGKRISGLVRLPQPQLRIEPTRMHGEIIYSDQFGNLLTSLGRFIPRPELKYDFAPWLSGVAGIEGELSISIDRATLLLPDGQLLSWVANFADISSGDCGIMVGSTGLLEIAANQRSAQQLLGLSPGDPVTLLY